MITPKEIFKFSSFLRVLYVEDDAVLRAETLEFFEPFFKQIDTAENGLDGLNKYNDNVYDIVLTDINMPKMNGIEMIEHIHEINPDQKIIAISAHNDSDILIDLIHSGVNSFILKPIIQKNVLKILYTVCRDARTQQVNEELFHTLNQQKSQLEEQIRLLESQFNMVSVKHQQVEHLLTVCPFSEPNGLLEEYFASDEDEGHENVLFHSDDCEEIVEIMDEVIELFSLYSHNHNFDHLDSIGLLFRKMGSILYRYNPFLDPLALSMEEVGITIGNNKDNVNQLFNENQTHFFALMDAIKIDMQRYVKRFSTESMAMKNIHHIHEPTSMSIRQVITLINPEECESCDIEFF